MAYSLESASPSTEVTTILRRFLASVVMCTRPEISLRNFDFITYSIPNIPGRELIEDEEVRNSEVAFPPDEELERCETFIYLGEEADKLYSEAWKKVKSAN